MAATDANPIAIKNAAYRITFFIMDGSGAPVTGAAGLDSERSLDGAAFADCTNEATEIGRGAYYLDLTAAEMNTDTTAVTVQTSTSGAKPTLLVIYPADRGFNDLAFPTTSGRSIDVAATGEVGLDFSNVNGTLDAAETTGIATSAALATVQADTDDIQTRLPAALVGGRMDSSVGAMAANTMTAAAAAADLTTEIQAGLATAAAQATLQADTDDIQTRLPAALVSGKIDASVGAMAANVMTAAAADPSLTTEIQAGLATTGDVTFLASGIAAVQADTDDLQTRVPAVLVGGRIDSNVGSMQAGTITAAAAAADFDAEVGAAAAAAIAALTSVELAAVPGVGGTLQQKIDFIFEMMRHKITQTGALQTIFKDDGVTPLGTSVTTDDDTTGVFTRGEIV